MNDTKREDAIRRLEAYKKDLKELWGPEYQKDPRYEIAIDGVKADRDPRMVILDARGL